MNKRHQSQDYEDEDEEIGNDEDSENNDEHPDAERPARPTSFDQDPALSTTSNKAIYSPKQTTPSAPLESFEPSHRAGVPSTGPSVTVAPLADSESRTIEESIIWMHPDAGGFVWIHNDVEIGSDLMDFRDRVIQENGGLTEPHEKLAVNFVFLIEGDHQTRGLHVEIEDEPWAALCEATRDQVDPLPKVTIDEAHQWDADAGGDSKYRLQSTHPRLRNCNVD
ncbi:hypothetical protein BGZ74_000078 [Mortierella antarctica]|nr:hypothetical protein BGZ74_000078 [Mortierella antarctica]